MNTCSTKDSEKVNLLKKLGAYNCNNKITINDILGYVYDYVRDGENEYTKSMSDVLSYVYYYVGTYNSNNTEKETRNSLLQSIIDGTYTPGSCTIDGCTDSVTPTSPSTSPSTLPTTLQLAVNQLNNMNKDFGIANIKRENDNYDIFFKGKEVLEYKAKIIMSDENLSVSDASVGTIDPIFKNLFNDDIKYNSHKIYSDKLYHARKEGNWNSNTVYKIFDDCNFKIESIDGIRYQDTNNNTTRVENLGNDSIDVYDVTS
tara:strand:+ start:432 stop:1208 length:777 start_codon:yes stop_codon:yes gene_type:complete